MKKFSAKVAILLNSSNTITGTSTMTLIHSTWTISTQILLQHFWGTGTFFKNTPYTKNTLPNEKMSKSILPIYNMGHVVDRKNGLVFFFEKMPYKWTVSFELVPQNFFWAMRWKDRLCGFN
jgi:hypothetical protein